MRSGVVKKYQIIIDNKDITAGTTTVEVFMDMSQPTWSCKISVLDSSDLITTVPILAGSIVKVTLATKTNCPTDGEKTFNFVVYKISEKMMQNQKTAFYIINCVAMPFMINQTTRITQGMNGLPTNGIKQIVDKNFKGYSVTGSSCDNSPNILIPNLTPFTAIAWLLRVAHTKSIADYLFFQNSDNTFICESINTLYTNGKSTGQTLILKPAGLTSDKDESPYSVINYETSHWDASLNMSSGYYANKLVTYDFMNKKWASSSYTIDKNDPSEAKVTSTTGELFKNSTDAHVTFMAKTSNMYEGGQGSTLDDSQVWLQSRRASIQKLEQEKLTVQLPGSMGITDWLGQTVIVDLPNQSAISKDMFDVKRRGKYLVTAMAHMYTRGHYTCNLELVKRSFNE